MPSGIGSGAQPFGRARGLAHHERGALQAHCGLRPSGFGKCSVAVTYRREGLDGGRRRGPGSMKWAEMGGNNDSHEEQRKHVTVLTLLMAATKGTFKRYENQH